jgi:RNA-directed DNA polymerase
MKPAGGLFDRMTTHETLAAAAWRAARGKRGRPEVRRFFEQADAVMATLIEALATGQFHFDGYRAFPVRDPKTRLIHAPSFRDRVVHHALIAVTGPVFERGAADRSYACRAGRGQHAALARIRQWLRRDDWFLKLDVARYYDSIPHDRLRARLGRRFREARLLQLWSRLLDSYAHRPGHGLPIGALTSQYLGNFYLDEIDHFILEGLRMRRFCRYMDDLILIADRTTLLQARAAVGERLGAMGLTVKGDGVLNRGVSGVPFLGFTVYPDRVRLDRRGRRRLGKKWRALESGSGRLLDESERSARAASLFAHACWADDVAWRRAVCRRTGHRRAEFGDTPGTAARQPRRLLDQHGQELPLRVPQQEEPAPPQQEPGLPPLPFPRHGGATPPPDDACSRAPDVKSGDETTGKSTPPAESRCPSDDPVTKAGGVAPFPPSHPSA